MVVVPVLALVVVVLVVIDVPACVRLDLGERRAGARPAQYAAEPRVVEPIERDHQSIRAPMTRADGRERSPVEAINRSRAERHVVNGPELNLAHTLTARQADRDVERHRARAGAA